MKKLLVSAVILYAVAFSANAQWFWGLQFGMSVNGSSYLQEQTGETLAGGSTFNYSIKPSAGYYFNKDFVVGLKLIYTSNNFTPNDTGSKATTLEYYFLNLLMGNGLDSNCITWKVAPYARYRFLSLFTPKVNIWAEFSGYAGGKIPRDATTHVLLNDEAKFIYGVKLHPVISVDLKNRWMLFTNLDLLSIGWEGATYHTTEVIGSEKQTVLRSDGQFLFQCNPLVALASCFYNIGIIKKF